MSDPNIQFETDQFQYKPRNFNTGSSSGQSGGITGWLIRSGIVSNASSASVIMIGIISVNFILAGLILYFYVIK